MCLGVIGAIALMLLALHEEGALVPDIGVWLLILLAVIPTGLIGLIMGVVFIWGFFLSHIAARIQGWPFSAGDEVIVLSGAHKNTRTRIYEVWTERGQVRVDLGPELKKAVKDIFCAVEVCKLIPNKAVDSTASCVTSPAEQEPHHRQP